jgi:hypothetical protein
MAHDANLKRAVRLVAQSLESFARLKQWKREEYWLFYRTKPELGRMHFLLIAVALNDEDSDAATSQVWDHLQSELGRFPEILQSINLVVRSKKKVDEGGLYAIGSEYREYRPVSPTRAK